MDNPEIDQMVSEIANDSISGASKLARRACECLDAFAGWVVDNDKNETPESYKKELITIGQDLVRAQPSMASVINAVNEIISSTYNQSATLAAEVGFDEKKQLKYLCTYTQSVARKYVLNSKLALEAIANDFNRLIRSKDVIMTLSASSAVEAILVEAFNGAIDFSVYIPESRPMFEGRDMAQRLAKSGIKTILIADSAMFHFLNECSKIIVGADCVTTKGIMNKIGTYGLAIAAKELKIPFYCVCERTKFIPDILSIDKLIVGHPEDQIFAPGYEQKKPEKLSVKNIYFDFTPIEYVTKFLTEDGMMTNEQVIKYIKNLEILSELATYLRSY